MSDQENHWNAIFDTQETEALGWFEADVSQTMKFLQQTDLNANSRVFLPGVGTSTLIEELQGIGCELILNDISQTALNQVSDRLENKDRVAFLHQDISDPLQLDNSSVDIWIDRAVLHFLLDEAQINAYFDNLEQALKPGGFALLAEFAEDGAPKCAGLELHRYTVDEFSSRLGAGFKKIADEEFTFINPAGDPRPYVYALYQKL